MPVKWAPSVNKGISNKGHQEEAGRYASLQEAVCIFWGLPGLIVNLGQAFQLTGWEPPLRSYAVPSMTASNTAHSSSTL